MRYKTLTPYKHKNLPIFDVEITSIDEVKVFQTASTKITFTARELLKNKTRQCVVWSEKKLNKGDILQIKGFIKEEIFVAVSFLRTKRAECEQSLKGEDEEASTETTFNASNQAAECEENG